MTPASSETMPSLTFVVPVRDDAERLRRCLASIVRAAGDEVIEIIVADNGSKDASPDVARAAGAQVMVLPGLAVAQMRNRAAAAVEAPLIALVDADHELGPGWVAAALRAMRDERVWAAGAEYDGPTPATWVQRIYDRFRSHSKTTAPVDWLPSGNLVVRREAFEKVRGFDETLESCEDVDFCRRIRHAGGVLLGEPALQSTHFGDPATLEALFRSELWRGRDNLRVSLRERLTARSAPSLVIPMVDLMAIGTVAAGVFTLPFAGWRLIVAGLIIFAGFALLRTAVLFRRTPAAERGVAALARTSVVAAVYDLARALALVIRVGHGVRRKGATR